MQQQQWRTCTARTGVQAHPVALDRPDLKIVEHGSSLAAQSEIIRQLIIFNSETMERSDLELVLAVQAQGSLAKAAQALRLTPPVATKRLAALEARLGVRLFQRTTRRVSPTTEGHALCERARRILQDFAAAENELREQQSQPSGPHPAGQQLWLWAPVGGPCPE